MTRVVLFGAVSVDLYPEQDGDGRWVAHAAGNSVNAGAHLTRSGDARVSYAGVLGVDGISRLIRGHLALVGIEDLTITDTFLRPAVSVRGEVDLPAAGPPGGVLLTDEYVGEVSEGADVVIVGSFLGESQDLLGSVLDAVPADSKVVLIPGSAEYRRHPWSLMHAMRRRRPWLLPLNEGELRDLHCPSTSRDLETQIRWAGEELAENVLCTRAELGAYLYRDGVVTWGPAYQLDPTDVVDPTGAGDRAAGITIRGLLDGISSGRILAELAEGTVPVLRRQGAQADLLLASSRADRQELVR